MSGQQTGLFTQLEEIDIDFRVSGLPHAVVKQAENFSARELVKKIESHFHREALQADLQQNNVYNPFCDDSKEMIREMGNVEFFELCETIHTKSAMFSMSSLLESRNYLLHLRTVPGAAVTIMNRLHRESGEEFAEPNPFQQYQKWHPSFSSSSWWTWDKSWWSS